MRPRKLRRAVLALSAFTVLAGSGVGYATQAHADETSFLQSLNNRGMSVYDTSTALMWGYAMCEALNTTNGADVAANFYRITNSDIPDLATATMWMWTAVEELCPWHDHRGQAI